MIKNTRRESTPGLEAHALTPAKLDEILLALSQSAFYLRYTLEVQHMDRWTMLGCDSLGCMSVK